MADNKKLTAVEISRAKCDEIIGEINENLKNKPVFDRKMADLKKATDALNEDIEAEKFAEFLSEPNPIIAATKAFFITKKKVKEEKSKISGLTSSVSLSDVDRRINLEALANKGAESGKLSTGWIADTKKLRALLKLKKTDLYNLSDEDLEEETIFFRRIVDQKETGETPDSNTQIARLIQQIFDATIYEDDGNGKNRHKAGNQDIQFIYDAITKLDVKEKATIAIINERQFMSVMLSCLSHALGTAYTIKDTQKTKDGNKSGAKTATEKETPAEKTSAPEEPNPETVVETAKAETPAEKPAVKADNKTRKKTGAKSGKTAA